MSFLSKIWQVGHVGFVLWDSRNGFYKPFPLEEFKDNSITKTKEPQLST